MFCLLELECGVCFLELELEQEFHEHEQAGVLASASEPLSASGQASTNGIVLQLMLCLFS